jgi:glycosyltransferase involved in cell wall biosynthesis
VSKIAAVVRRILRKPIFVTDHGGGAWDITSRLHLDPRFDGFLHVSEFSRRIARQLDEPRAHVVYAGVDPGRFSPPPAGTQRTGVLYVGRIMPHKGVDVLIEALPDGVSLDVVGSVLDERFRGDLNRLAAGRDVRFHHDWDDERVRAAYRSAACVVLPSVYRDRYGDEFIVPELLGQTLLEGMACGAPAICTDVGGMPEVVEHGVTGFIVPPNDPAALRDRLVEVLSSPARTRELGDAGLRRVRERFVWDRVVARCLTAYQGLPIGV